MAYQQPHTLLPDPILQQINYTTSASFYQYKKEMIRLCWRSDITNICMNCRWTIMWGHMLLLQDYVAFSRLTKVKIDHTLTIALLEW